MLAGGSRTAEEFRAAWNCLNGEAKNVWNFLGLEPSGALADPLEGVGGNSLDGSTRTKIVQQREGLRHQMLEKALKAHPDRAARPVTVYQNVSDDKCAGSWLLAIPNRDNSLSTPVFREAMSAHLCLPSPALGGASNLSQRRGHRPVWRLRLLLQGDTWRFLAPPP